LASQARKRASSALPPEPRSRPPRGGALWLIFGNFGAAGSGRPVDRKLVTGDVYGVPTNGGRRSVALPPQQRGTLQAGHAARAADGFEGRCAASGVGDMAFAPEGVLGGLGAEYRSKARKGHRSGVMRRGPDRASIIFARVSESGLDCGSSPAYGREGSGSAAHISSRRAGSWRGSGGRLASALGWREVLARWCDYVPVGQFSGFRARPNLPRFWDATRKRATAACRPHCRETRSGTSAARRLRQKKDFINAGMIRRLDILAFSGSGVRIAPLAPFRNHRRPIATLKGAFCNIFIKNSRVGHGSICGLQF